MTESIAWLKLVKYITDYENCFEFISMHALSIYTLKLEHVQWYCQDFEGYLIDYHYNCLFQIELVYFTFITKLVESCPIIQTLIFNIHYPHLVCLSKNIWISWIIIVNSRICSSFEWTISWKCWKIILLSSMFSEFGYSLTSMVLTVFFLLNTWYTFSIEHKIKLIKIPMIKIAIRNCNCFNPKETWR